MAGLLKHLFGIRIENRPRFQPGELVAYDADYPHREYCRVVSLEEYKAKAALLTDRVISRIARVNGRDVRRGKIVCLQYPSGGYGNLPSSVLYRVNPDEAVEDVTKRYNDEIAAASDYTEELSQLMEKEILFVKSSTRH